jgi:hypothetical protein
MAPSDAGTAQVLKYGGSNEKSALDDASASENGRPVFLAAQ